MNVFEKFLLAFSLSTVAAASAQQPGTARPVLNAAPAPETPPAPSVAPPVTVASPDSQPIAVDASYVIGPDDSIQINVWKEPSFTETVLVRPDGKISMPAIGDIPAAGRTPMQLGEDIKVVLKKLVIDPTVTVSILSVNSKRVYMVGEVGRVGPMALAPGMNILEALVAAGGPSPFAHSKNIYILRGEPGKQKKIFFNYKKAVKTGDMQGVTLEPGDMIVVP